MSFYRDFHAELCISLICLFITIGYSSKKGSTQLYFII